MPALLLRLGSVGLALLQVPMGESLVATVPDAKASASGLQREGAESPLEATATHWFEL
jgi:predicted protein tyrosine phosphatase